MGMKDALRTLGAASRVNIEKIVQALPENLTTRSNAVKTPDLRIDVHQDTKDPDKAVAKIQANSQAKDAGVKAFIKSGNKGGGHKGTHKNIAVIPFNRKTFNIDDFEKKINDSS